jgi:hypothetical protein
VLFIVDSFAVFSIKNTLKVLLSFSCLQSYGFFSFLKGTKEVGEKLKGRLENAIKS